VAATIYDVATRAGVSISTVSLALNAPGRVRPTTLSRILSAADELGYTPKPDAVVRARRGVRRIGVIAPFTSYPSFARRLYGMMRALRNRSVEIVVYDEESAVATVPSLASIPLTNKLDGLVVMSLPLEDATADRITRQALPTVLVEVERSGFSTIAIDNAEGGRLAGELLVRRGHHRFGFIGETFVNPALPADKRLSAYRAVLAAAGHTLPDSNVIVVPATAQEGCTAAHALLDLRDPPTAIFAHHDVLASGVLKAARERRLRVPDDLAIVGFDDSEIAEPLGLTTIRQPLEESGAIAVQTLLAQLDDPDRSLQHIMLRLSLVERDTT
jgi:DNA-binding LacI/PurR family transcriptional regulator